MGKGSGMACMQYARKVCHTCTNQCTSRIWCLRCYHRQSPRDFTPCARRLLFFLTPGLYWTLRYLKLSWRRNTVQEVTAFLSCKWLGTYWGDGTRSLGSIGCYSALLRSVVTKELMILFAFCALAAAGAQKPLHQVNKLLRSHCDKSLSLVTCTDMIRGILRLDICCSSVVSDYAYWFLKHIYTPIPYNYSVSLEMEVKIRPIWSPKAFLLPSFSGPPRWSSRHGRRAILLVSEMLVSDCMTWCHLMLTVTPSVGLWTDTFLWP